MISAEEIARRLVRADQLIEKGDPIGELMQVQCELGRGGHDRARRIKLRKREPELKREIERRWYGTALEGKQVRYRLGVVDAIMTGVPEYVRDREAIRELAPDLRHVGLWGLRHKTGASVRDPDAWMIVRDMLAPALEGGEIRSLGAFDTHILWNSAGGSFDYDAEIEEVADEIAEWLVRAGKIATLHGLELSSVTPRTLRLLASTPEASQLDELALKGGVPFDDGTVSALRTTALAPRRIVLVSYGAFDVSTDDRLLQSPFVARAIELEVPGLRSVAIPASVRKLTISDANDPAWLRTIADAPELAALEELSIKLDLRTPVDLGAFGDPKRLDALRVLRFESSRASLDVVRAILRSPLGARLEVLAFNSPLDEVRETFRSDRAEQEWDGIIELS